ncbi:MAG: hypothetical protein FWC61_04505 [Proteobacteria bacterium]|nr:hypothetical protein [Pseudomonadota bacterium]
MPTKNTRSTAAKPAARPAPAAAAQESAPCGCCCCQRSGFWHGVKKLIIVLIIFGLGVVAGKILCFHHMGMMRGPGGWGMGWQRGDMFVNGCLDMTKISCPVMAQKVAAADANGDGCITRDEMRAWKQSMRAAATSGDESDEECDDE